MRSFHYPQTVWSALHALPLGAVLTLAVGCPGSNDTATDTDEPPLDCDIPVLFEQRCGGSTCHGGGESSASDLDLVSPGVEERVSGATGTNCSGILADSADPEGSLLYTKTSEETPTCGVRMPIAGEPLTEDELTCMRYWISGLLPPGAGCTDCDCEPGVKEDCYSGLEGTADVGICQTGTHTCQTSGMGFSECAGEVIPRGEDCYTPDIDENCDGATPECSESWSIGFGDPEDQSMRSVAVDDEGNVYGFGHFEGTVSLGGDPLTAVPSVPHKPDLALTKHDLYGNHIWSFNYGDNSTQHGIKVLVDGNGGVIYLARIYGAVDLSGAGDTGEVLKAAGGNEILIFKLDTDGQFIWSRMFGDKESERSERMVIDSQGDVIMTGVFPTTIAFGDNEFTSAGMRDAFVVKLDGATGNTMFASQFGGTEDDYGFGVDVDAADSIFVTGRFGGTIEIGGTMLTSAGGLDIYVAELSPTGVPQWARSFGGSGADEVHDLRVQQNGNIVLLGGMTGTMNFGGPDLVSAGSRDVFLATLDPTGNHVWSARYGDANDQFEPDGLDTWLTLALHSSGNIYIGGSLYGSLSFGAGGDLTANGDGLKPDVFYFRTAADGSYLGGARFGGTGTDSALDIAVTESGYVVLPGRSTGTTLDFGTSGVVTNAGSSDGYIAKLAP